MQSSQPLPALLLSLLVLMSSMCLLSSGNASEKATPLATSGPSKAIQDNLVNPAGCRHCRTAPCMGCEPVCCPKRVNEKEENSCWKVACEYVCVPGFRFPWEKCCGPVCGWVRCIHVLEEHKYECDTCGYEWDVKYVRTNKESNHHRCKCPRCQRECR